MKTVQILRCSSRVKELRPRVMWMRETKASSMSPGRLVVSCLLCQDIFLIHRERGRGERTKRMPSKYSSSRRKMETRALRFTSCTSLSWRKISASSRRSIAFQVTAYSNTSLSLTSKCSGSVPRSPQLMVNRGHLCFSATHSAVSVLPVPGGPLSFASAFSPSLHVVRGCLRGAGS